MVERDDCRLKAKNATLFYLLLGLSWFPNILDNPRYGVGREIIPYVGLTERGICTIFVIYKKERYIMNHEQLIREVAGAITRLQMGSFNMSDGNHISRVVVKLCKENKELKEELDDTLNDCVNQDKELNQLKEELSNTELAKSEEDSLSLDDLKEVLNYIRLQRNEAPDVYYKISKVIRERESLSPKEMTVEEIEREMGYTIKVVK